MPEVTTLRSLPLMLFLHGAGERGNKNGESLQKVKKHGPWRNPDLRRFLVVAPQCPSGLTWSGMAKGLWTLLRIVRRRYMVDESRTVAAGLSMGAFGCWSLVSMFPGIIRCVLAVCGGYAPPLPRATELRRVVALAMRDVKGKEVRSLKKIRVWLFHGSQDQVVVPKGSRELYRALGGRRRSRKHLRLTLFSNTGHACWGRVFRTAGLLEWAAPSSGTRKRRHG